MPQNFDGKDVIDIQPGFFNLWYEYELVTRVDDSLAAGGKAASTIASTNQWTVQYSMHDIDDFNDDLWRVYVMARVEPKPGAPLDGPVLSCGVYGSNKKREIANVTKSMGEIGTGGYHLFDLGALLLNPGCFVFTAPVPNENARAVLIERMILVRESKKAK